MLEFILNDKKVATNLPTGSLLVDFIRQEQHLSGTKIGCREGDCGACTVLVGTVKNGQMDYQQIPSCLTPIGNIEGKHVVTIEGLNMNELSPVQQHLVDESGTQCGFCTPGFVVSLSQYCLSADAPTDDQALASISGNICRCTGYKPIERAAAKVTQSLAEKNQQQPISWLVENHFLPAYFNEIPERLAELAPVCRATGRPKNKKEFGQTQFVGGGTDLYVQKHEALVTQNLDFAVHHSELRFIKVEDGICTLGASTTVTDLLETPAFAQLFPDLTKHLKLVSSAMIRNVSTLAGNFVNASPIGDMTAFFLALNAQITLQKNQQKRTIFLKDFYKGYKDLDLDQHEIITEINFNIPFGKFNFEKVSKRTHLDIASVNTAISIITKNNIIQQIHLSTGGVGPTPTYLTKTCNYLVNKELSPKKILEANEILQQEISPISDVRGNIEYKRLLLRQLFFAHFIELYPEIFGLNNLTA